MTRLCFSLVVLASVTLRATVGFAQMEVVPHPLWMSASTNANSEFQPNFGNDLTPRVQAIDTSLPRRVHDALAATYAMADLDGRHGIAASVITPQLGLFTTSVGMNSESDPMYDSLHFEIASNTKTFVTALIFKLQELGKLSISDSLWKWLPHFENIDSTITLRQLLAHSSGIYDYLNDDSTGFFINDAYFGEPTRRWTPQEILTSYIKKPNFKPGKGYRYCNTNFLLLGQIAERASGMSIGEALRHYFLDTLDLHRTTTGWDQPIPEDLAHNYYPLNGSYPSTDLFGIDHTAVLTSANTAGGILSTPADLAQWAYKLYTGQLLSSQSLKDMTSFRSWSDGTVYGLGTMRIPYGSRSFIGHTGRLIGFVSYMFTNPKDSVTFVLYANHETISGDKTINDYAIALLDEVYKPAQSTYAEHPTSNFYYSFSPDAKRLVLAYQLSSPTVSCVRIVDALGRVVSEDSRNLSGGSKETETIDLARLSSGNYYVIATAGAQHYTGHFTIIN